VQVAQERAGAPVAIVTDLSSADWDASLSPEIGTQVPRGTMRLNAGRAQMMFNSGAVVDVIGPAEFELLGESGATLKRGKMMAWVPPRAQGFTVDVPGMKLVDLGTQFGVHVLANDVVEVHVLQGVIEAHPQLGVGGAAPKAMELTEQQAIRFDTRTGIVEKVAIERVRFNRRPVVSGTATVVDLLDVIAWGDGSGEAHSRGVEPHTGEKATKWYHDYDVTGTPVYKRIDWSDVIDGVFVPDKGDVTLNSAGDRFDGFPNTDRKFISPIWTHRPRKDVGDVPIDFKSLPQEKRNWIREAGPSTRYNPEGRGMLALHANAGVTFDLDVVRKRYPDHRIVRFHATTGNIQGPGGGSRSPQLADVWVFTGGELRFNRNRINSNHGTFEVDIEIRPDTRFLTLVATDSSNGYNNDQIVFGDPVIELEPR